MEGSDFLGEGAAFEFDANVSIAKNLDAPVIIVVSGEDKTTAQIINAVRTIKRNFKTREVQVLAVVVNKVKQEQYKVVEQILRDYLKGSTILSVIPENQSLKSPTMKEIQENLNGKVMFGEQLLSNQADHSIMGAMQLPNFLNHIQENVLIITPGDRADIILAALQANISVKYPKVAGIVLTGGFEPEESIIRLISGLQTIVPLITVKTGSFQTATLVGDIKSRITPDNYKKIQLAINTFREYVDVQALDEKIVIFKPKGMTPHMFQYQLVKWAKSKKKHIVLPEGNDERILRAAGRLVNQDIVDLSILGDENEIEGLIRRFGINLDIRRVRILNPATSE